MKKAFYQFDTIFEPENAEQLEKLGIYNNSNLIDYVYDKIYIDINQIEVINESNIDGYLTIRLYSGYSCMIKWTVDKLLKLIKNSQ